MIRAVRAGIDAVRRRLVDESASTSPWPWLTMRWFMPWCIGFMQGRDLAFIYVRPSDYTRIYGLVVVVSVLVVLTLLAFASFTFACYLLSLGLTFLKGFANDASSGYRGGGDDDDD